MEVDFISSVWPAVADGQYEEDGLGGAEAALVLLSRALASRGHRITIYGETYAPGFFNGVSYQNLAKLEPDRPRDVVVLVKAPYLPFKQMKARRRVFWLTDVRYDTYEADVFPFVDLIFCMSEFHRSELCAHFPTLPSSRTVVLNLGVLEAEYFGKPACELPPKNRDLLIYCSMPDRGLTHLTRLFPQIREEVPSAELVITSDFTLYRRPAANSGFRDLFCDMPGVRFLAKVPRQDLVRLQFEAKVMAYPCTFPEGFCIAALECMAAGAVPVSTAAFALTTTIGDCGILLPSRPGEPDYDRGFIRGVTRLLKDGQFHAEMALRGRTRVAVGFLWSLAAQRFEDLVG
jgi:glycosyltransferase involved in cell wall biosynthesis